MAFTSTGMQALFPVYLSRMADGTVTREGYDIAAAQNEANLNQNLETLFQKLSEIETYLTQQE